MCGGHEFLPASEPVPLHEYERFALSRRGLLTGAAGLGLLTASGSKSSVDKAAAATSSKPAASIAAVLPVPSLGPRVGTMHTVGSCTVSRGQERNTRYFFTRRPC